MFDVQFNYKINTMKTSFTNVVQNHPDLVKKLTVSKILKNNWLLTTAGDKIVAVDGVDVGDETGSYTNEEWYVKNNKSIIFSFPNLERFELRDDGIDFKINLKKSPKLKYIKSYDYTSEMRNVNRIVYKSFRYQSQATTTMILPYHDVKIRNTMYYFTKRV
jgi:hypothetical protein